MFIITLMPFVVFYFNTKHFTCIVSVTQVNMKGVNLQTLHPPSLRKSIVIHIKTEDAFCTPYLKLDHLLFQHLLTHKKRNAVKPTRYL